MGNMRDGSLYGSQRRKNRSSIYQPRRRKANRRWQQKQDRKVKAT